MQNTNLLIIVVLSVTLIWQVVLTIWFVGIFGHYKRLIKGVNDGNLEKILNKVLQSEELNKRELSQIKGELLSLQKQDLKHLQKVGFLRFNPFNETGGDNSFSLSILNGDLDGFVITGLHTREKTRMYAKKIERGKSKYELSKEEQKVVNDATR
jgi:hypothetical protein